MGINLNSVGSVADKLKGLKGIKNAPNFVNKVAFVAKKSRTPLILGAGVGLYLGYKIADLFTKSEVNTGIIPESKKDINDYKCDAKPRGIINQQSLTIKDLIDKYNKDKKYPAHPGIITINDLIDQLNNNRDKTKLDRLKDFLVILVPKPINPVQNPFVNQDKYSDFIKEMAKIEGKNYDFDAHRIPANLTAEERMEYLQEHGGPGLNYDC